MMTSIVLKNIEGLSCSFSGVAFDDIARSSPAFLTAGGFRICTFCLLRSFVFSRQLCYVERDMVAMPMLTLMA